MLYELMTAIKNALAPAFIHPRFIDDRSGEPAGVKIHIGQLPFKRRTAEQSDFPFLLVQPVEGADGRESEATVRIHCGVYNDESGNQPEAGANDLLNMVDRVRRTEFTHHRFPPPCSRPRA
jgi:hypothetical protein